MRPFFLIFVLIFGKNYGIILNRSGKEVTIPTREKVWDVLKIVRLQKKKRT